MKRLIPWTLVPVILIAAGVGYYFFAGHSVPANQPPLADVTSLDALKADFNRTPDQFRIILLMSPT